MAGYQTAQVCRNGHAITDSVDRNPGLRSSFCRSCGAATMTECESCHAPIRGYYHVEKVLCLGGEYHPPDYCHSCGVAYPWTRLKIVAAEEAAEEIAELTAAERDQLKASIPALMGQGLATDLAVSRVRRALKKLGAVGAQTLQKMVADIASESVRKSLGL